MRDMYLQNKKGVSEIVSYVILVIIAVSVSTLVYSYLVNIVPKDRPECKEGVSLTVENYICNLNSLNLTVKNRGRFNITAAYIRIGNIGNQTKFLINSEVTNQFQYAPPLSPNEPSRNILYPFDTSPTSRNPVHLYGARDYILEIQIAYYDSKLKRYSSCQNSLTQTISCKN